jgi:hypothetical protein
MTASTLRFERSVSRTRCVGAVAAAAISLSLAVVPIDRVQLGPLTINLVGLGLFGAPLVAVLALWLTPVVTSSSWRRAAWIGVAMGVGVAYFGVLEVALLSLVAALLGIDAATGFGDDIAGSLFVAFFGLPFGTLVLPITIPFGLAWAVVMRSIGSGSQRAVVA